MCNFLRAATEILQNWKKSQSFVMHGYTAFPTASFYTTVNKMSPCRSRVFVRQTQHVHYPTMQHDASWYVCAAYLTKCHKTVTIYRWIKKSSVLKMLKKSQKAQKKSVGMAWQRQIDRRAKKRFQKKKRILWQCEKCYADDKNDH